MTEPRDPLVAEMQAHTNEPFPESVTKGDEYGEVCSVMVAADIYGWASHVSSGGRLAALDRTRLQRAADELDRSLASFPVTARPYYERLLHIAHLALDRE